MAKKAISYSIFGYSRPTPKNCFSFESYVRGLWICIRINRLLYPGWENVINLDADTYNSPFRGVFDYIGKNFGLLNQFPNGEPLCKAMLYRLKPVFFSTDYMWDYSHVLCRDVDSVGTYREAQAVQQWIHEDKTIHCITDSISHNVPMMGGMIGVQPRYFTDRIAQSFDAMLNVNHNLDFNRKGTDQDFLNKWIYPNCADSATEHFVLGMVRNLAEGNGRHYSIPNVDIDCPREFEEPLNAMAGHIGAAGAYSTPLENFLMNIDPYRNEYLQFESKFPTLFYWSTRL